MVEGPVSTPPRIFVYCAPHGGTQTSEFKSKYESVGKQNVYVISNTVHMYMWCDFFNQIYNLHKKVKERLKIKRHKCLAF